MEGVHMTLPPLPVVFDELTEYQAELAVAQYLDLESRLHDILTLVPYLPANRQTVMPRLAGIVVDAGTLVDSICRAITPRGTHKKKDANIVDFASDLEAYVRLSKLSTLFYVHPPEMLTPFASWGLKGQPDWWKAYNELKHERLSKFDRSTLDNAVKATCAVHQLVASLSDFIAPLVRHGLLKSRTDQLTWAKRAHYGWLNKDDAMVETEMFLTCIGPKRFPKDILGIDPSRYVSARCTRLERFLPL
jgi:hypothetical protein